MMPEAGNALLCAAIAIALLQTVFPLFGAARGDVRLMGLSRLLACLLFVSIGGAFVLLMRCLAENDFTVAYVAANSSSLLPVWYRLAAAWGAHEGSLLLWVLLMSGWTFAVALCSRQVPIKTLARVLAVMGLITLGMLLFIVFTSNPFARTLPDFPLEGRDLNPMLQDPGLILHPPLLYMGYVGFSVSFAFAIAALLGGEFDRASARSARPWALAAWIFLTLGMVMGSAWAYYELGWGGWWFWDPVENASLMPWLVGTALLHSLIVSDKRDGFKAWTLLLSIAAFSLCLLGTFLVRSGVLVSVHAFASDPARGMTIMAFIALIVGGSLLLFALRGYRLRSRVNSGLWSRESLLLGNNVLLMTAMLVVLLGTLLPLVHKQLGLGSISVGEPFFNSLFVALMVPFSLLMGLGPLVRWGRDNPRSLRRLLPGAALIALAALLLPWLMQGRLVAIAALGVAMALVIVCLTLALLLRWHRAGIAMSCGQRGMVLAHLGVAVTVIGIAFSQNFSVERDVRMRPGESVQIQDYRFTFDGVKESVGPNWIGSTGALTVTQNDRPVATLLAEKRRYGNRMVMTEAAIDGGLTRDLYAALGEPLDNGTWALRLYIKPFVRWIWAGGLLMALGGLVCLADPRLRKRRVK
ncbi:heme lyase CcmF/NrfE family subunit [Enterobacter soli]|uniref:heme lyase CcmF/NrfE family subunit n=1 Tax=Enterobacter soli TaxID=885040 RepID=UPI0034CE19B5